jgi:hypothetical protein
MVIKTKVRFTTTKVTHTGAVTVKQIELYKDSRDYKQLMKRYSSYKRWGNVLVSYIPNTRYQTSVIMTPL